MDDPKRGTVFLTGAGPGDPELLTVRADRLLATAGAIVYDALVGPRILDRFRPEAERFDVGRRKGEKRIGQTDLNRLLVELSGLHEIVVRLKGGDPFVYGHGGEEAIALTEADIKYEVVPGLSAGTAVPAYAGIPLTHRNISASAAFVTGHQVAVREASGEGHPLLAYGGEGTLVIFMGLTRLERIVDELILRGRPADTPAAVVESGTLPGQRTIAGTLATIAPRASEAGVRAPAIVVVGEVVALRDQVRWLTESSGSGPSARAGGAGKRAGSEAAHEPNAWTIVTTRGPSGSGGRGSAAAVPTAAGQARKILAAGEAAIQRLERRGITPDLPLLATSPVAIVTALRATGSLEEKSIVLGDPSGSDAELARLLTSLGARVRA